MTAPLTSPDPQFPSVRQAVGLLLLFLLVQVLVQAVAAAVLGVRVPSPAGQAAIMLGATVVVLSVALRRRGETPRQAFPLRHVGASLLAAITLTVLGGSIVLSEADNVLRALLPPPAWLDEMFEQLLAGEHLWASLLLVAVIAPLAEELVFRGVVLRGFLARYSEHRAIIASALLFGASHLNPWQFVGATAFGLLSGWWFARTGSLIPCLVGHALNNALPAATMHLLRIEIPGYTGGLTGAVEFQPLWFDLLGLALLAVGLGWTAGILAETDGGGRRRTETDGGGC